MQFIERISVRFISCNSNFHEANLHLYRLYAPIKKVTKYNYDLLYFFYPGFVFIRLDIPGKPVYFSFE